MVDNDDKNNTHSGGKDREDKNFDPSRRRFVKNTGMVVGGVAGGSLLGSFLTDQLTDSGTDKSVKDKEIEKPSEARMFFTRFEDFAILEQATERIFPEDDNGPGAIDLGVPYFIDKQLASSWGMNGKDYRQGPFPDSDSSSDNSSLSRGELFINGIRKMNELSKERFDEAFNEAEEEEQIEILQDFEDGEVDMKGTGSDSFFTLLRETTLEGVYSDPLYGGNRNMDGWKMKEYPGAVSSYSDIIEEDEFIKMDPVSLTDYQQKS